MPRAAPMLLAAGCLLVLTLVCFGPVLFQDRRVLVPRFGRVLLSTLSAQSNASGRPVAGRSGNPRRTGAWPLLGNPSAAVLYPGKILYVLPYAWAARLYVIAHVLLAFIAMRSLLRSWGISPAGTSIGALAYAFGAPVLSQYGNVIFLVGAAWAPLGLLAVDRLVRLGRPRACVELAAVLALQMLGGDPQTAYLVVLCGGFYTIGLAARGGRRDSRGRRGRR